ncbi:hypothetical protein EON62_06095 [archaeon]|nr:MAG: hypothetical protein EON62_06095 [archaeon]
MRSCARDRRCSPCTLPPLPPAAGFYDWRVVAVSPDGTARPVAALMACDEEEAASHLTGAAVVTAATPRVTAGASAAPATFLASSAVCLAQGRYIVQREGLATEQFRELIVDLDGMKFTPEGQIKKHGTFEDIASRLPLLKGTCSCTHARSAVGQSGSV